MKKLMFATALVASVAAFGAGQAPELLNANSFEGYTDGASVVTSSGGTSIEQTDGGSDTNAFFTFVGDSDSSVVKAFGGENAAVPGITRPKYYADSNVGQNFYLALDTEGGTLWRALALDSNDDPTAKAVATDGTYLDTLVQFTVTEDEEPTVESGDKLAIWLQAGDGETNLMAKAKYYFFNGGPDSVGTNFVLVASEGTKDILPNTWYRLTVKAISNVLDGESPAGVIPAFEIYIDGVQMCATEPQFETGAEGFAVMAKSMATVTTAEAIDANKMFPSLAEMGNVGDTVTLTGVGFKGTGAIDDLVWTEENPLVAAYPTYVDTTDTTVKNQYDAWKAVNGADATSEHEKQFLLNVSSETTVPDDALEIESITENQDGDWDIVVKVKDSVVGAALSQGEAGAYTTKYYGYLTVKSADDLANLDSATAYAFDVEAIAGGKVKITVTAGKFMKVQLTTTPGATPPSSSSQD